MSDGKAIEVEEFQTMSHGWMGFVYSARCGAGHRWQIPEDELRAIADDIGKSRPFTDDRKLRAVFRDLPHLYNCPECATIARVGLFGAWDDPDHLLADGMFE